MSDERQIKTSSSMDRETEIVHETAHTLVSEVPEHAAANLLEPTLSVWRWDTAEGDTSGDDSDDSSDGSLTQLKARQHLEEFPAFSEHLGDVEENKALTDPSSPSAESMSEEKPAGKLVKSKKRARKKCFGKKSKKVKRSADDAGNDSRASPELEEENSPEEERRSSPPQASICWFQSTNDEGEVPLPKSKSLAEPSSPTLMASQVSPFEGHDVVEDIRIPATGPTRSEESVRQPSSASCSSTSSPVTKAARLTVSQVIEETVRTLQSLEAVSALDNTDTTNKAEKPARRSILKKMKTVWEGCFGKKKVRKDEETAENDSGGSSPDLTSFPLKGFEVQENPVEEKIPSQASCWFSSPDDVDEVPRTESQPPAEGPAGFLEEPRSLKSTDSHDLKVAAVEDEEASDPYLAGSCSQASPPSVQVLPFKDQEEHDKSEATGRAPKSPVDPDISGSTSRLPLSSEDSRNNESLISTRLKTQEGQDETPAEHQLFAEEPPQVSSAKAYDNLGTRTYYFQGRRGEDGAHKEAVNWQLVIPLSEISAEIRKFFQSLSETQWREISEGVYNEDVKERLVDMCADMLKFITDGVVKVVDQLILQKAPLSGAFAPTGPSSSEQPMELFNCSSLQGSFESSFSQALHEVTGANMPVNISDEFSKAMAEDIRGYLLMTIPAPLDGALSDTTCPACYKTSTGKATERTLAGAITTLKSFLTGRVSNIKTKVRTNRCSDTDVKEVTAAGVHHSQKKAPVWRRCWSAWRRKRVQPVKMAVLNAASSSAGAGLMLTRADEQEAPAHSPTESRSSLLKWKGHTEDLSSDSSLQQDRPVLPCDALELVQDGRNVVSSLSSVEPIPPNDETNEPTADDSGDEEISASVDVSVTETDSFSHKMFTKDGKKNNKQKEEKQNTRGPPRWKELLCCCCTES